MPPSTIRAAPRAAAGWARSRPGGGTPACRRAATRSGRACGSYLDVYGPAGPVRAEVVDVCTDCAAGTVNLSRAAFARIADPRRGTVVVSYRPAIDPPLPGPLMLRIAAARRGRLAVQVINHGNRLSSVAASRPGGGWLRLAPDADGYWTGPLRPGPGRATPGRGRRAASASGSPTSRAIRWCSPAYRCAAPWCAPPRGCTGPRTGPLPGPPAAPGPVAPATSTAGTPANAGSC